MTKFYKKFFDTIKQQLENSELDQLNNISEKLKKIKKGNKAIIIGNGGSSALASHVSVDLTKNAKVRAINFNESDLLTCFSNDYGYEKVFEKALDFYADKGDVVIFISSSGKSKNLINDAKFAKKKKLFLITLTGFSKNNPLSKLGSINLWVNSKAYNIIETTHQIYLLSVVDKIIGKTEYPA